MRLQQLFTLIWHSKYSPLDFFVLNDTLVVLAADRHAVSVDVGVMTAVHCARWRKKMKTLPFCYFKYFLLFSALWSHFHWGWVLFLCIFLDLIHMFVYFLHLVLFISFYLWVTFDLELAHSRSGSGSVSLLPVMWWSSPWWQFIYRACAAFLIHVGCWFPSPAPFCLPPPCTPGLHRLHWEVGSVCAGCGTLFLLEDQNSVSFLLVHQPAHSEHQSHCCSLHWILLLDWCHTHDLHLHSILVHTSWLRPCGSSVTLEKLLAATTGSSSCRKICISWFECLLMNWRMCFNAFNEKRSAAAERVACTVAIIPDRFLVCVNTDAGQNNDGMNHPSLSEYSLHIHIRIFQLTCLFFIQIICIRVNLCV